MPIPAAVGPAFIAAPRRENDFHETGCLPPPGAPMGRRFRDCPFGAAPPSGLRHRERLSPPTSNDRTHEAWRPHDQRDHAFGTVPSVCAPTGPTLELGSAKRGVGVETPIAAPLPQRPGNFCDRESSRTHVPRTHGPVDSPRPRGWQEFFAGNSLIFRPHVIHNSSKLSTGCPQAFHGVVSPQMGSITD